MALRVLHLSTYAGGGGAGRAAAALNQALQKAGVDSRLVSAHGSRFKVARAADRALWHLQRSSTDTWRSPARFGSLSASEINASPTDVVNLHWVTDGFMSIEEIGKITKPLVMSMYDMWAFCGTEHYGVDHPQARWRTGYTKENRSLNERGWDIDRNAWERKCRFWERTPIVTPSTWLARSAQESALFATWPVLRIPHPVDPRRFRPFDKFEARRTLGLDPRRIVITFLASAGIADRRKGFDLLLSAIRRVPWLSQAAQILLIGPNPNPAELPQDLNIQTTGIIDSDAALLAAYSAADVVAVPSREDNMPLTAMEAQMSGRPVVAFNIGGMNDLIQHGQTGYLATPFSVEDLSHGLHTVLSDSRIQTDWGRQANLHALETWSSHLVAEAYLDLYQQVIHGL